MSLIVILTSIGNVAFLLPVMLCSLKSVTMQNVNPEEELDNGADNPEHVAYSQHV